MFRRVTGRYPIVIGIIILTVANISIWKFNDDPESHVVTTNSQTETLGQGAVSRNELPVRHISPLVGEGPVSQNEGIARDTGLSPLGPIQQGVDIVPIPKKENIKKMAAEEIWDFPRWGAWNSESEIGEREAQDRFNAAPGHDENSPDGAVGQLGQVNPEEETAETGQLGVQGVRGVRGVKDINLREVSDPKLVDFNAIHKGRQPDTYMRLFGNILQDSIEMRKSAPVDYGVARKDYKVPEIERTKLVNCKALLEGDARELDKAQKAMDREPKIPLLEETYEMWLNSCEDFKRNRGYVTIPLTEEEENYPLAFSIAIYTDIEQFERLLRAVYQPQNIYCIHIDTKSPLLIHQTAYSLVSCFENVFIASHLDKIKWGDVSVLLPAINCMRDMVKYHRGKWKYFINLTGQEMPLRTNWELVQIAKIFNGSNDIGGSTKRMEMDRVNYRWSHRWSKTYQQTVFYNTMTPKDPDPWNLTFYKGELHGLFSHKMTEYIIESEVGMGYLQWCWNTGHPTEHYWNTLNYNTHLKAPGGFDGPDDVAHNYSLNQIARAKHWVHITYGDRQCHGKITRGICVYGVGDVPWLHTRKELVANKFHLTYQFLAYDCLEERHRNRTILKDKVPFDAEFYKNLPTVKYGRKDGL